MLSFGRITETQSCFPNLLYHSLKGALFGYFFMKILSLFLLCDGHLTFLMIRNSIFNDTQRLFLRPVEKSSFQLNSQFHCNVLIWFSGIAIVSACGLDLVF